MSTAVPYQPSIAAVSASRLRTWLRKLGAPALLLLIIAGFYWKLVFTYQFDWLAGPDTAIQVLPWFEEDARQIRHGRLPLWDPHLWAGQPQLAQAQPGAAYPFNWLLFLLPFKGGHINVASLQWYYVLERWMAALFCYLFCRDLGRSRGASIIGGLIFALASYVGTTDWPQMVNGAVWAPLVLLFLMRAGRGYKPWPSAALCGLVWGVSWLSGHHQVPLFISVTAGGLWLYYILRDQRIDWRMVRLAGVSIVIMGLTGAFQILPSSEYGHLAKRWAGAQDPLTWNQPVPYSVHALYSLKLWSMLGILFPGLHQNADPFVGIVAFTLALIAIAAAWKQHAVKVLGAIALGGIVYSLGSNSVFQGFLYAVVPMLEKARVPSMAVVIFSIGVASLAAFGADHVFDLSDSAWGRRISTGLLAFGLFVWAVFFIVLVANRLVWQIDDRLGITGLSAILLAALLYGVGKRNLKPGAACVLLTMLLLFELGNDSGFYLTDRSNAAGRSYLDKTWGSHDVANYLNSRPKPFRVGVDENVLNPNWAEYYNLDTYNASGASILSNFTVVEFYTPQTKELFNIQYSVGRKPDLPGAQAVFEGAGGVKVFYNPSAFPRAWAVHQIVSGLSVGGGLGLIRDHLDELHHKAIMFQPGPALENCGSADDVRVTQYRPDLVSMRANMACSGMVVLSDNFYPGWKATVDGKPERIYEVNFSMRGVAVPKGVHKVRYRYRPMSVYLGAALSICGALAACGIMLFERKRRREEAADSV